LLKQSLFLIAAPIASVARIDLIGPLMFFGCWRDRLIYLAHQRIQLPFAKSSDLLYLSTFRNIKLWQKKPSNRL